MGKRVFISGEQRSNFEGNRGTKTIWGTGNIRKQMFDFWGTGEQANLLQGNKGTGTPPSWEGLDNDVAHMVATIFILVAHLKFHLKRGNIMYTCTKSPAKTIDGYNQINAL